MGDYYGLDDFSDAGESDDLPPASEPQPTPGERLFYALGQLYRLYRNGSLDVRPIDFDVWDLAGIIGVRRDVEFVSEDQLGTHYHFANEVLEAARRPDPDFPWRLLGAWEWAAEQELASPSREWWER